MDCDNARELLKKYWEGETDPAEERLLKDFFSQNSDLPQDLQGEKNLFGYLKQEESSPVLKEDLTAKLRKHWNRHQETPVKKMPLRKRLIRHAAVLVPLTLAGYFLLNTHPKEQAAPVLADTFADPKKALAETEKALLLLSQNMNDGVSKMEAFKLFDDVRKSGKFKEQEPSPTKK